MTRVRLTRGAVNDIRRILRHSETEFGASARARYKALVDQAIRDIAESQTRVGVRSISDVREGYFAYHLRWSKPRVVGPSVARPRHILVFSVDRRGDVILAAVVHEREMLDRHLED
jgi:plasmid stabilization system protein ParE